MESRAGVFSMVLAVAVAAAGVVIAAQASRPNPLLTPSRLPFQAPPFDHIRDADFLPAFDAGMKEQREEVRRIADNSSPATFDNTLVALERSGQTLTRVQLVFNALTSANTNDTLQKLQEEIAPKLSAHQDDISLNPKLFQRIASLYDRRDNFHLAPETKR